MNRLVRSASTGRSVLRIKAIGDCLWMKASTVSNFLSARDFCFDFPFSPPLDEKQNQKNSKQRSLQRKNYFSVFSFALKAESSAEVEKKNEKRFRSNGWDSRNGFDGGLLVAVKK
jgi:hypothetical protein